MSSSVLPANRPYRPYGAIKDLFYSRDRAIVLDGPAGTGKSRGCMEKVHMCLCEWPGSRALFLRQTRESLTDSGLVTFENEVLPEGSRIKMGPARKNRHSYDYPNGSEIVVGGLDDVNRIMSSAYDIIYIQELIEVGEDDYEMATTRLRSRGVGVGMPFHQLLADTNPGAPTHWIKQAAESQRLGLWVTHHEDNPLYYSHETKTWTPEGQDYIERLEALTGHRRDRMLLGRWVPSEGARYPQLDAKLHKFKLYDTFPYGIPSTYPIILGVDYGTASPYCCLWIAVDYDKNVWVFREVYRKRVTVDDQATEIIALTKENERIRTVYADPAFWARFPKHLPGPEPELKSAVDFYRTILGADERFGPIVPGFNKSRRHALDTIDVLLNKDNGFPNLYIEEGCTNLWNELVGAVWDGRGLVPEKNEDIDPSCPDHAITALYYAVHTYLSGPDEPADEIETDYAKMHLAGSLESIERQRRRIAGKRI